MVVYDYLNFLHYYYDSNKEEEAWFSELSYVYDTELYSLFDKDQILYIEDDYCERFFILLENNKYIMTCIVPPSNGQEKVFYSSSLRNDADKCVIKTMINPIGRCDIQIQDAKGVNLCKTPSYLLDSKPIPNNTKLVDAIRPVSVEELLSRGERKSRQFSKKL